MLLIPHDGIGASMVKLLLKQRCTIAEQHSESASRRWGVEPYTPQSSPSLPTEKDDGLRSPPLSKQSFGKLKPMNQQVRDEENNNNGVLLSPRTQLARYTWGARSPERDRKSPSESQYRQVATRYVEKMASGREIPALKVRGKKEDLRCQKLAITPVESRCTISAG